MIRSPALSGAPLFGAPESLSVHPKIESKCESTVDFGHHFIRQLARPALQSRPRQRTKSLHIRHRVTVEKPEPGQRYFIRDSVCFGLSTGRIRSEREVDQGRNATQ